MCLKLRHQRWFGWNPAVSDRETAPFKPVHRVSFLPVRPTVSWVRCFIHLHSLGGNLLLGLQKDEHHPKKFLRIFISLNLRPTGRSKAFLRGNSSYRKVQSVAQEADGGGMEPLSCFTFRVQWRSVHVDVSNLEADSRWVGDTSRGLPGSQVGRRWTRTNEWKECEAGCVGCGRRSALPTVTPRCRHSAGIPFTGGMFRHEIKKKTQLFADCSAPSQDVLSAAALAALPDQTSRKHLKATVKRLGR